MTNTTDAVQAMGVNARKKTETIAGCTNTALIKYIALASMIVDHVGMVLFPSVQVFRVIGRIAFPLFAWCMVVGAVYTRNIWKYTLRVLITGLIAQPVFHTGTFLYLISLVAPGLTQGRAVSFSWTGLTQNLCIFSTLFLALLALAAIREKKYFSHIWGPALCVIASLYLGVSYGWRGMMIVILLYMARSSRTGIAAVMITFCLLWSSGSGQVTALRLTTNGDPLLAFLNNYVFRIQFFALFALPFMLIPIKQRVKYPKWLAYSAYPVHLALIKLIALLLGKL